LTQYIQTHITQQNLRILNIGCATGGTTTLLESFGPVTSVEFDGDCCDFVRNSLNMEVYQGDIVDLQFKENSFDLVCAFDVLEHVKDDVKAAKEMFRVCKSGGHVFVTVPAYEFLWSEHDEINHHKRRYNSERVLKIFDDLQFQILVKSHFNSFLFIPIALMRIILSLFPKIYKSGQSDKQSDFDKVNISSLKKIFYSVFKLEVPILKKFSFPFGVSIVLLLRKK
jgi:SAM-dependent methyltransferase